MNMKVRKLSMAFCVVTLSLGAIFVCCSAIPALVSRLRKPEVSEISSPLDAVTVAYLCHELVIPESSEVCLPASTVYAPDFFPAVYASFEVGVSTYDDVHSAIGEYEYSCKPPVTLSDGTEYFRCHYDFKGDRVFTFVLHFTGKGVLKRVLASAHDTP